MPDPPVALARAVEEWLLDLGWKWEPSFSGGALLRGADGELLASVEQDGPGFWGVRVALAPGMPESGQGQRVPLKGALLLASSVAILHRVVHRAPGFWVNDDGVGDVEVLLAEEGDAARFGRRSLVASAKRFEVGSRVVWSVAAADAIEATAWEHRDWAVADVALRALRLPAAVACFSGLRGDDPDAEVDFDLLERARREVERLD